MRDIIYMSKRNQLNYKKRPVVIETSSGEDTVIQPVKYYVKKQQVKSAKRKTSRRKLEEQSIESCSGSSEDVDESRNNVKCKRPIMKSTKMEIVESSEDDSTISNTEYDFETESPSDIESESIEEVPAKHTKKELLKTNKVTTDDTGYGTDITDTCYEDIDETYSRAKFLDLDVVIDKNTSYVNCSKMIRTICEQIGKDKDFYDWKQNVASKEYCKCVSKTEKIPECELFKGIRGSKNALISGTYCHPLLVSNIAGWVSPLFGVMAARIINEFANKQVRKIIREKDSEIAVLHTSVNKLSRQVDDLINASNNVLSGNEVLKQQNKKVLRGNEELKHQNKKVLRDTKKIKNTLDFVVHDRVVHTGKRNDEAVFYIGKNNDKPKKLKKGEKPEKIYEYCTFRVARKSLNSSLSKYRDDHPNMRIIKKIDYTPNSINLWTRIRDDLRNQRKISGTSRSFNLIGNFTQSDMLAYVEDKHNERLRTTNI